MRFKTVAVLLLLAAPAFAQTAPQSLPAYDIPGRCHERAGADDGKFQFCVEQETLDSRNLSIGYDELPAALRSRCESRAKAASGGLGSFHVLQQCITVGG